MLITLVILIDYGSLVHSSPNRMVQTFFNILNFGDYDQIKISICPVHWNIGFLYNTLQ